MQFAEKTVTLATNVQQSLSWGISEFYLHLGKAIINDNVSVALTVRNAANHTAYIGFSYQTETNIYNLGTFNIGIPANSTVSLNARNVPALAYLNPGITRINTTINTVGAGVVGILLDINTAIESTTATQQIGGDIRSVSDFIRVTRFYLTTINPGGIPPLVSGEGDYIVPAGKRAYVEKLEMQIPPTAFSDAYLIGYVTVNGDLSKPLAIVRSVSYQTTTYQFSGQQLNLEAGEFIQLFCGNAYVAAGFNISANISFIEYY